MFYRITVVVSSTIVILNSLTCDDPYECASTNLIDTEDIECFGYSSCLKSSLTSGSDIACPGSYSCYKAIEIIADHDVWCDATYSCAQSNSRIQAGDVVYCNGDTSCMGSQIIATTSIHCGGYRSCANSSQMTSSTVELYGYLSGANTIFTNNGSQAFYYFHGIGSGHNQQTQISNGQKITYHTRECQVIHYKWQICMLQNIRNNTRNRLSSGGRGSGWKRKQLR